MWKRALLCLVSGLQTPRSPQTQAGGPRLLGAVPASTQAQGKSQGQFLKMEPLRPPPSLPALEERLAELGGGSRVRPGWISSVHAQLCSSWRTQMEPGPLDTASQSFPAPMQRLLLGSEGSPSPKGLPGPAPPSPSQTPGPLHMLFLQLECHPPCTSRANCPSCEDSAQIPVHSFLHPFTLRYLLEALVLLWEIVLE